MCLMKLCWYFVPKNGSEIITLGTCTILVGGGENSDHETSQGMEKQGHTTISTNERYYLLVLKDYLVLNTTTSSSRKKRSYF